MSCCCLLDYVCLALDTTVPGPVWEPLFGTVMLAAQGVQGMLPGGVSWVQEGQEDPRDAHRQEDQAGHQDLDGRLERVQEAGALRLVLG